MGKGTEGELVDFRLPMMGAHFDERELRTFLNESKRTKTSGVTPLGDYVNVETGDGMQIWFAVDRDRPTVVRDFDVHYKTNRRTGLFLESWGWQRQRGMFGLANMIHRTGKKAFQLRVDIVDAAIFVEYEKKEVVGQLAAFGYRVRLFPGLSALKAENPEISDDGELFGIESRPDDIDESEWEPSAQAFMSAKILSSERAVNAYTGGEYYHLVLSCWDMEIDALLRAGDVAEEPVAGGYVQGEFYITGRLFHSLGDEGIENLFDIDADAVKERFPLMKFRGEVDDEPQSGWELLSYPVMPDKGFLLVYQNATKITAAAENDGVAAAGDGTAAGKSKGLVSGTLYYRILRNDAEGNIIDGRRFKLEEAALTYAYFDYKNHLHIIYSKFDGKGYYAADIDEEERAAHPIGEDVSLVATDSRGRMYVGRDYSGYIEWTDELMTVYGENGEKLEGFESGGYCCSEILLDDREQVWFLTEPALHFNKVASTDKGLLSFDKAGFPLSRVKAIAMSEDGSRIFCECSARPNMGRFYTIIKKGGRYGMPAPLSPPLLAFDKCDRYGQCSTCKDRVIIAQDNILYMFKVKNA